MCTHNASGHSIGCQAVCTHIYSDKHTNAREEIKISPPNLSKGANFHLRFMIPLPCLLTTPLFSHTRDTEIVSVFLMFVLYHRPRQSGGKED